MQLIAEMVYIFSIKRENMYLCLIKMEFFVNLDKF